MARIGIITAEIEKPSVTSSQSSPALYPKKGGNIRFPAPKNNENSAKAITKVCLFKFIGNAQRSGYLCSGSISEDRKMIFHYHTSPIYYTLSGKGPALVLLHGFLESSTMWEMIVPEFETDHTVLTLDLPGHGKSASISETHTMECMADVLLSLLTHLNISEAIFVGHSMGGYVLMALAEVAPSKISKLVLLNSTPSEDTPERKANRERALLLVPKAKDAFVSMAISNLFSEKNRIAFASTIERSKKEALTFPLEGILAAIKGMKDREDRTHILATFSNEKHMIAALEDPILPFSDCISISEETNTPLHSVAGGHMSHVENFVKIVKIVRLIVNNCV
jgi:pimeloyl-ACP methyl ester carboxylesterase